MALSRIWAAFILIAFSVACFHFFSNNSRDDIFGKMVAGTAKDDFKYVIVADSLKYSKPFLDSFSKEIKDYGYVLQTAIDKDTRFVVTDNKIILYL